MSDQGLRERKKRRTRVLIAETAARLFAERGYENVSMTDVARAAEVAEQTVYNYFRTKERLVLDLEEPLQDRLADLIRSRPAQLTPAAAIRGEALAFVESIRSLPPEQIRGGLGRLAVLSPAVRRLSLEMTERMADALAAVIADTTGLDRWSSGLQGIALAWVFHTVTEETGRMSQDGRTAAEIADALVPVVTVMLDHLDTWTGGQPR